MKRTRVDPASVIEPWEWRDAEIRLDLMEAGARRELADRTYHARIVVKQEPVPEALQLLPASALGEMLLGPDGRPIGG